MVDPAMSFSTFIMNQRKGTADDVYSRKLLNMTMTKNHVHVGVMIDGQGPWP